MVKVLYDQQHNVVILEYIGKIEAAEAEEFYPELQKVTPKHGKGFRVLTDLSQVEYMDPKARNIVKTAMDFLDKQGVTEIFRVIADPSQDIGFNIMSHFHYSEKVKISTFKTRDEANTRL